jgi:hypothetical protein
MSKNKHTICVKQIGDLAAVWEPHKPLWRMKLEKENYHLEFLEKNLDFELLNSYFDEREYKKNVWTVMTIFRNLDDIQGCSVIYELKVRIKNGRVYTKDLYTMYLDEKETQEELEYQRTEITWVKTQQLN